MPVFWSIFGILSAYIYFLGLAVAAELRIHPVMIGGARALPMTMDPLPQKVDGGVWLSASFWPLRLLVGLAWRVVYLVCRALLLLLLLLTAVEAAIEDWREG